MCCRGIEGAGDFFRVRSEPAKPNLSESGFLYNAKPNII